MTTYRSLNHTKWHCQDHVVFIPKYRKKAMYGGVRQQLGEVLRQLVRIPDDREHRFQSNVNTESGHREQRFR